MEIALINRHNFTRESLDAFSRYQVVKNVYRVKEGEMYLAYRPFVETWTLERKREKAAEILAGDHIVYGAFEKKRGYRRNHAAASGTGARPNDPGQLPCFHP